MRRFFVLHLTFLQVSLHDDAESVCRIWKLSKLCAEPYKVWIGAKWKRRQKLTITEGVMFSNNSDAVKADDDTCKLSQYAHSFEFYQIRFFFVFELQ